MAALNACGGGGSPAPDSAVALAGAAPATASSAAAMPAGLEALPAFHMAPAVLAEPSDVDVGGTNVSGRLPAQHFSIAASLAGLATARLTPQALAQEIAGIERSHAASTAGREATASPKAIPLTAAVYTPAQIRAAYGLSELPAVGATVSAAVAASLGAGQTIYLVDAGDNPNALSDLARFSAKFGLPACTGVALTVAAPLPLAAAGPGCTFSVAHTDSSGVMKAGTPAYSVAWAPEIALDVQWAHAIAPLARLVLIEVNDASTKSLLGGVQLANRMGAGVVSMSFGAPEGAWVTGTDSSFAATGMTYIASTGDAGTQVNWPAVSPHVLAVGGTSLEWSGSGTRYEAAWSGSGGGISAHESLPSWQAGVRLPGVGALARRAVSDVSFNADPVTGQYVALTAPGSTTTNWNAYGGTSIAAPQWAGLVAIADAQRLAASKAMLGDFHSTIYAAIAGVPGSYAAAFGDVVDGNDGSCASCNAAIGYDQATGWGSPNAGSLLPALMGGATVPVAPIVPGGAIVAKTGVSLTRSLGITAPAGVTTTYALVGAPTGLAVDAVGELKWASPATGSYTLTATAKTSAASRPRAAIR
jgi:subtilase family serine protease